MSSVVLYGPPLAGKSTIVQCFARATSLATESFEIRPPGQAFAERGYRAVRGAAVIAATIAGAVWTMATWDELLRGQGDILLVLDPQESRRTANREYVEYLGDHRRRVAAMQITKTDLVGAKLAEEVAREVSDQYALNVPITYSTTGDIASVCGPITRLSRIAP